ncbi:MAG: hypothetical protein K5876_07380 [Ruminiclostridium sp.]|nr:hypothetical protein [Ruminiclostridium sp.]
MDDNENMVDEAENERFNSMLNAAQKQVGASPSENQESSSAGTQLTAGAGKLSQAQIEAMLAINNSVPPGEGQNTESVSEAPAPEVPEEKPEPEPPRDEDDMIADKLREGLAAEMQPESDENSAPADNGKKKKKEKQPKEKKEKPKKEKKPVDPVLLSRIITVVAAVVAAALGFCVCLLMFTDVIKSGNEQFAIKAANAVNSKLSPNTDFYVYRAYVWNRELSDECMLYGLTSYHGVDKMDIYRVVVEHDNPTYIYLYYTIDENSEAYLQLKLSEDSKKRIQASQLKNHSDSIYDADREIQINAPKWQKVDCAVINKNITSEQEGPSGSKP